MIKSIGNIEYELLGNGLIEVGVDPSHNNSYGSCYSGIFTLSELKQLVYILETHEE